MPNPGPATFVDRETEIRGFCKLLRPERPRSVMLIGGDEHIGKSWLLLRMVAECQQRAEAEPQGKAIDVSVAKENFRSQRDANEVLDDLGLVRLLRDRLGQTPYFDSLNEKINDFTKQGPTPRTGPLVDLAKKMAKHHDLVELRMLCASLDVEYEELPDSDRKTPLAYHLVKKLDVSGHLPELVAKLEEEHDPAKLNRPVNYWQQGLESHLAPPDAAPEAGPASDDGPQVDRGAPLPVSGRGKATRQINDAFFECLKELASDGRTVVLLFDSFEEAPDGARSWLRTQLLDRLGAGELGDVVVILAGRSPPNVSGMDIEHLVDKRKLGPFDKVHVRQFFEAHNVEVAPDLIESATLLSGGVPGELTRMVDRVRAEQDRKDPFLD